MSCFTYDKDRKKLVNTAVYFLEQLKGKPQNSTKSLISVNEIISLEKSFL